MDMSKKRRTKKQKMQTQKRRTQQANSGFVIPEATLKKNIKMKKIKESSSKMKNSHFRSDLTKTLLVTMLALALELACWRYFFK
jgi:hypothetical protein